MSILNSINQFSFKKLTAISFITVLVLAIPISIFVFNKQTKLGSEAYFAKPEPIVPGKRYGSPSAGNPQITLVWPFLGKIGDAVLIYGQNLGDNPMDKTLMLGNNKVSEKEINKWTPTLIEFNIPKNTISGPVSLTVAGKKANWPFPFTIYTLDTKTQVTENNNIVRVLNGPPQGKIEIFFRDNTKIESQTFKGIKIPNNNTIISIKVINKNNSPIQFFVNPNEFGF